MKSKMIVALVGLAMLSACKTFNEKPPIIRTEYKVVTPDEAYYTCDKVMLPDPDTLTDARVAQLINDLVKANRVCHNNMNAIKKYLDEAKKTLESR
jgi:hypothetical protein